MGMTYIVQRNQHFYVVAYNGHDPITGRERRCWHPAGTEQSTAMELQRRLDAQKPAGRCEGTLGAFLTGTWMGSKLTLTHPTRNRYRWMIDNNIAPRIGHVRLDKLRSIDLDACYQDLLTTGGKRHQGLSPKTVLEVHRVVSNALDLAVDRQLLDINPALRARPPRPSGRSTVPKIWTAAQLREYLDYMDHRRLYPALRLVAHSGMRRGEVAGLNWGDLNPRTAHLSIARTRQSTGGRTVEAPVKTRTSRRCIDIDQQTLEVLARWRQRLVREGATITPDTPMFVNREHRAPSPESFSQLFVRSIGETDLPRIRFHDLRHTHASLLLAAGIPIKVVSERLGHSHPAFTMHTYQHLIPGMGAAAAAEFAQLVDASR